MQIVHSTLFHRRVLHTKRSESSSCRATDIIYFLLRNQHVKLVTPFLAYLLQYIILPVNDISLLGSHKHHHGSLGGRLLCVVLICWNRFYNPASQMKSLIHRHRFRWRNTAATSTTYVLSIDYQPGKECGSALD